MLAHSCALVWGMNGLLGGRASLKQGYREGVADWGKPTQAAVLVVASPTADAVKHAHAHTLTTYGR